MISYLLVVFTISLISLFQVHDIHAQSADSESKNISGEVLCIPNTINTSARDCLNLGPAAYISRMADLGISFPLRVDNGFQLLSI